MSYLLLKFLNSFQYILIATYFSTLFLTQLFLILPTTYYEVSDIVTFLAEEYLQAVIPAIPVPDDNSSNELFLNFGPFITMYLAKTILESQSLRPS